MELLYYKILLQLLIIVIINYYCIQTLSSQCNSLYLLMFIFNYIFLYLTLPYMHYLDPLVLSLVFSYFKYHI